MKREIVIQIAVLLVALIHFGGRAAGTESGVSPWSFAVRTWGRVDGLPGDAITAILQTHDGYLWVGTSAGLVRFDGIRFTTIRLPTADTNAPPRITALCEEASGDLWVGTHAHGLFRLAETGVNACRQAQGLLDEDVASLASDAEGRLWVGTRSGLNRWDGTRFVSFTSRDGLTDESVTGVHVARSGAVWITTRSGMYQFKDDHITPYDFQTESQGRSPEFLGAYEDRRGNLWAFGDTYLINLTEGKRFNYFRGAEAAAVRIWSLCEGRDGRLWIGTSGRGLFCFDDNRFQPVTLLELQQPNDVRAIHEDREGSLWMGTSDGGLVQLLPQPGRILKAGQGLPADPATCLAANATGRTYIGFDPGGIFDGESGRFESLTGGEGLEGRGFISSLWAAPEGTLWIATLGAGLQGVKNGRRIQLTTLNGLSDDAVLAVCGTPDGSVWASTAAGVLHEIPPAMTTAFAGRHELLGSPATALLPARNGGLWLGTADGAVLSGKAGSFSVVCRVDPAAAPSILALHEDAQGRLWIGTAGGGLACWTGQRCRVWHRSEGLPDDTVYGVLGDEAEDLWFGTASGIYRVSRAAVQDALRNATTLACQLMFETKAASRQIASAGWPRALRAADGRLWFASPMGAVIVDTRGRAGEKPPPPPVYVESVLVNGQPFSPAAPHQLLVSPKPGEAPVRLPTHLRVLELQSTALSFISPEKTRFRHKLEGFDQDWVMDGTERRVRYGPLPYGEYRFRVAASHPDGEWIEAAPFAFQVTTPLWRTPAALALYILAAVGAVTVAVRVVSHRRLRRRLLRLEQQQALERERMRIAQDMHDEIGSKLTKISFLSERVKVESAGTNPLAPQIASIADTSRELLQTLDEIVWAVNPHNDTLEHLAAYLSQYAGEYFQNTTVECDQHLPRSLPHHPLSAEARHNLFLTFEEALNNVLKHAAASQVRVDMVLQPTAFEINIADNGHGFDVPAPRTVRPAPVGVGGRRGGNGLVNMRQRLADVGGECVIRSQRGQGTTVSLRIPLNGAART